MKKFALKLILFFVLTIIAAYLLQWVIDTGLKKSSYSAEYKEWYEIYHSKIDAKIIIQGSSRSWVHFSPKELETAFNMPAYNLGLNGQAYPMQKWRFDIFMKYNKKPDYLIQSVDANFFNNPVITYDYNQFIPYLNKDFDNRFKNHSFFKREDFLIPLYKYTHTDGAATAGIFNFFNKAPKNNGKYKGFKSYSKNWNRAFIDSAIASTPNGFNVGFDTTAYHQFLDMINRCKSENIRLILVYSPVHASLQKLILNKDSIVSVFKDLSVKNNLSYFDYSNIPLCSDTTYFYNANHLNTKGVEVFNKLLINDLKTVIR